ncbi:MAG: hypothetical protein AABW48_00405 [Nanoarchaeota archaeon]
MRDLKNYKLRNLIFSAFLLFFLPLFLVSCTPAEKTCAADADCVPAQCCHPTDAVNLEYEPDCSNVACTMDCKPETLDCGQGEIKCLSGKCTVTPIK